MRRNESPALRMAPRVAVRRVDESESWDPLLYSAEIATAGMLCGIFDVARHRHALNAAFIPGSNNVSEYRVCRDERCQRDVGLLYRTVTKRVGNWS